MNIVYRQLLSFADPAERQQRLTPLQQFVGRVQTRFQRLQWQLLAGQWPAQSADDDRPLQAKGWPAVT